MKFTNSNTFNNTNREFFRKVLFIFNRKRFLRSTHSNNELRTYALIFLRKYKPSKIIFRLYRVEDFHFSQEDDLSTREDKVRCFNKLCFYISYPNASTADDPREIQYPSASDETIGSYLKNQQINCHT